MARYYIETAHFLDKIWYPAGATIDWDGPPSEHMIPIEEWQARRENRANAENRGQVVSNPNASPPTITGNTLPAKVAMAGPEEPAVAVAAPNDERNPDYVPPNQSRPITPGADEAAQSAPAKPSKRKPRAAKKPTSKAKK